MRLEAGNGGMDYFWTHLTLWPVLNGALMSLHRGRGHHLGREDTAQESHALRLDSGGNRVAVSFGICRKWGKAISKCGELHVIRTYKGSTSDKLSCASS